MRPGRKTLRRVVACWLVAGTLGFAGVNAAEIDAAKHADIRQLIGAGGQRLSQQLADTAARTLTTALRARYPTLPERVLPVLARELTAVFEEQAHAPGGLVERIVQIYDRHFTHQEIKELLAFNQTPVGRKALEVLPVINTETIAAGHAWGMALAPDIQRRVEAVLKAEGVSAPAKK